VTKILVFVLLAGATLVPAQKLDPIQFQADPAVVAGAARDVVVKVTARMEKGWHLYSLTTPRPPLATTIQAAPDGGLDAGEAYQAAPVKKLDPSFGVETETFEGETVFYFKSKLKAEATTGAVVVRYQACDDKQCLPPKRKTVEFALKSGAAVLAIPAGYTVGQAPAATAVVPPKAPVTPAKQAPPQDLGQFLLLAFGLGLAAVFTPCVFPMIPLTMSHFLNMKSGRVGQAILFCLGIVVLFTALGLGLAAALGPFGAQTIASNPWINGVIALIFLALGLSLMGAFELQLPSSLLTKLNAASSGGGSIATILMGLTFALSSFACVGPFVGTLLAASATGGDKLQPVLGMASFASGLALPFFFLALFPGLLGNMPRSGGWLMRVKIVMGFCVLALMFKYLANVDVVLGLNWLTRERFLALWIVLFALPGLYLLGFLRMEGVKRDEELSLPRLLCGAAFLVFSLSLIPGMFGANLGELEGMIPAPTGGYGASLGGKSGGTGLQWTKNNLPAALEQAKRENKMVFVNFTGYTCTNCHWMKANMFTKPEVAAAMKEFILVELYTDDPDEKIAEQNQRLLDERYKIAAVPYYVIVGADDQVRASFPSATRDTNEWLQFLSSARSSS